MSRVVPDADGTLDDKRHARKRPQIGGETVSTGTAQQRALDATEVLLAGPRRAADPRGAAKGSQPASLPLLIPSASALPRHPKGAAHLSARGAAAKQISGGAPALLERGAITGMDGHLALTWAGSGRHEHMFAHSLDRVTTLGDIL